MPAPIGNKNAVKNRPWTDAIRKALARKHGSVDTGLAKLADKLVEAADEGDKDAANQIWERLEGKTTFAVELSGSLHVNATQMSDEELLNIASGQSD